MIPNLPRSILFVIVAAFLTLSLGGCVYYPGSGPGFYGPALYGQGYSNGPDGGDEDR